VVAALERRAATKRFEGQSRATTVGFFTVE
jgi:hypothetical protein